MINQTVVDNFHLSRDREQDEQGHLWPIQNSVHPSPEQFARRPTENDISLARVILMDPVLASVTIQELLHRNRALLAMVKSQQEALQLLHRENSQPSASPGSNVSTENVVLASSSPSLPTEQLNLPPQPTLGTCVEMACPQDAAQLSPLHCKIRQCIEFFAAEDMDVATSVRGRKKKILMGQVGLRCSFCKHLPIQQRQSGAVYYPMGVRGVYQAANRIAQTHLVGHCKHVPRELHRAFQHYKEKQHESMVGLKYWVQSCILKGIEERSGALWFK